MPEITSGADRCAVHPARPALDSCPVCGLARCGADAAQSPGGGCRACLGGDAEAPTSTPAPGNLERVVRAGLASYAVSLLGGLVASQYVEAGLFSYVAPFVVGVVCGAAATKAGGTDGSGRLGTQVRGVAALLGVLGVAFGFLTERSQGILSASALLPYAAAAAGAVLWTLPPRNPQPRNPQPRNPQPGNPPARSPQDQGAGADV